MYFKVESVCAKGPYPSDFGVSATAWIERLDLLPINHLRYLPGRWETAIQDCRLGSVWIGFAGSTGCRWCISGCCRQVGKVAINRTVRNATAARSGTRATRTHRRNDCIAMLTMAVSGEVSD